MIFGYIGAIVMYYNYVFSSRHCTREELDLLRLSEIGINSVIAVYDVCERILIPYYLK